ncbi:MAG: alpha/beta hydrolase [Clostridia bacterium]|nr:alpha/beta hydrolase [Clostridia bacterium]
MKNYVVDLKAEYGLQGGTLTCLVADRPFDAEVEWKRPALIVVPGGGYAYTSKREAEPIAFEFLARGFHTFILDYRTGAQNNVRYPEQLLELSAAVDYVKKHSGELCVNKDEVFAIGFSAGGHLVGNLAIEYASVPEKAGKPLDCKPTAVGLCYPVISKIHGHQGSFVNLLDGYSEEAQAELLKTLNLNEAVTENTPPAFLWATATDGAVPADNALRYALALAQNNVPYELHIYPKGSHGLSAGNKEINMPNADKEWLKRIPRWLDECTAFFRLYIQEKF